MKRNPAAPLLLRASALLAEQARALDLAHSVNGVGRVFRDGTVAARRRELRSLANRLKLLSAAFGRSELINCRPPRLKVRP